MTADPGAAGPGVGEAGTVDPRVEANRQWWDDKVALHAGSAFYDLEGFRRGASALDPIEAAELGPVDGARLLHLQCHFGLTTLSLTRAGARVTGVDFSAPAIDLARRLASELGVDARFVRCTVDDAPEVVAEEFDVVFSSYGVLSWLPDLERWATTVARMLRPGGRFHLVELHPAACMFDDEVSEPRLRYPYFRGHEPLRFERPGTYAVPDAETEHQVTYAWPAAVSDVLGALLGAGLELSSFREFTTCHEQLRPWLVRGPDARWTSPSSLPPVPLVYALRARRPPEG
jgi:SAM-dependent methyltransferase